MRRVSSNLKRKLREEERRRGGDREEAREGLV
jgi:hypothetical protein